MGNIRAKALYSSPKYDFVGVVDSNVDEAAKLGGMYRVSILSMLLCMYLFIQFLISLQYYYTYLDITLSITKRSNHHPIKNKTRRNYNLNTNTNTFIINNYRSTI